MNSSISNFFHESSAKTSHRNGNQRQPLLCVGWSRDVFVSCALVFMVMFRAHVHLRILTPLLDWKRCSKALIRHHSSVIPVQLTRSDSLPSFGGLWMFSPMKDVTQCPATNFLIDILFVSFEISSHLYCLQSAMW